jgi:asparagine synthase (glutamine-hydrolysing)
MCGIAGIFGQGFEREHLEAMVMSQRHRGPDDLGLFQSPQGKALLGHNRLSIIDLTESGHQPMASSDGRFWLVLNGEIYNYLELRSQLGQYPYKSKTDTEVVLAAYAKWGEKCLERFIGMFSLLIWDEFEQSLFAARDRFGVKPLNYHLTSHGTLLIASEIKALHAAGVPREPDPNMWSTYFCYGISDHSGRTFWQGIESLAAGHFLIWKDNKVRVSKWYDLSECSGQVIDERPAEAVEEEYSSLLKESVRLRFRSDVPVGINLSGGLDSSILLGLIQEVQGSESDLLTFTFVTGDSRYDELPWVRQMLARTHHSSIACKLDPASIPMLADSVQEHQDEPFGGLPTLAYAQLFEIARAAGIVVLLDGQGLDEQWGGYDYYRAAINGSATSVVQGTKERPVRPECLTEEFRKAAEPFQPAEPFPDPMRNLQFRDAIYTKIPRALRFNDRVSMRFSCELREPFLDHRLFELALKQPADRKISNGVHKVLLRKLARGLLPGGVVEAPKRPLQTPQREWLANELRDWASSCIDLALAAFGSSWLDASSIRTHWRDYCLGAADNSYFVWQWISLALTVSQIKRSSSREQDYPLHNRGTSNTAWHERHLEVASRVASGAKDSKLGLNIHKTSLAQCKGDQR